MRNVFDQYNQPENKLTHALVMTLEHDRSLVRPFLRWLGLSGIPLTAKLLLGEQHIPGALQVDADYDGERGLPDACIYDEDGWAVLFECKIQAPIKADQIRRHRKTAERYGFESPYVYIIAVDEHDKPIHGADGGVVWRDIYAWFNKKSADSFWAREFVRYMEIFERKMLPQDYEIRGTITVFDGLRFDADNPYTYREGKRLIRLLGDELQARKDLHQIGVDPQGARRPAITGRGRQGVWDLLPLVAGRDASQFTSYPHLTMSLLQLHAVAAVTVPNGVKGGFRNKLRERGQDAFTTMMATIEKGLRPVIKRSRGSKPMVYVSQRHYKSQRSAAIVDASVEADLRTAIPGGTDGVKYQPEWLNAIYDLLTHKKSNLQLGIEVRLKYDCPIVRSAKAMDLFAETWQAVSPLISFVHDDE